MNPGAQLTRKEQEVLHHAPISDSSCSNVIIALYFILHDFY